MVKVSRWINLDFTLINTSTSNSDCTHRRPITQNRRPLAIMGSLAAGPSAHSH